MVRSVGNNRLVLLFAFALTAGAASSAPARDGGADRFQADAHNDLPPDRTKIASTIETPHTPKAAEVEITSGRSTSVIVEPFLGRPFERQAEFVVKVPSYRLALARDREQRWMEATALYQQALVEIGATIRFERNPLWEQATFKIDIERRRSQVLAHDGPDPMARGTDRRMAARQERLGSVSRLTPVERGRLLRLKVMSVRAATGSVPGGLVAAAISALNRGLDVPPAAVTTPTPAPAAPRAPIQQSPGTSHPPRRSRGGDPDVRLLLCATRAAGGDRNGARLELAHVAETDRSDPARALSLAACQAALKDNDNALASLAVAVYRMGPTSRFLPGQTRELQSSNDWDVLRLDRRFDRLFR